MLAHHMLDDESLLNEQIRGQGFHSSIDSSAADADISILHDNPVVCRYCCFALDGGRRRFMHPPVHVLSVRSTIRTGFLWSWQKGGGVGDGVEGGGLTLDIGPAQ